MTFYTDLHGVRRFIGGIADRPRKVQKALILKKVQEEMLVDALTDGHKEIELHWMNSEWRVREVPDMALQLLDAEEEFINDEMTRMGMHSFVKKRKIANQDTRKVHRARRDLMKLMTDLYSGDGPEEPNPYIRERRKWQEDAGVSPIEMDKYPLVDPTFDGVGETDEHGMDFKGNTANDVATQVMCGNQGNLRLRKRTAEYQKQNNAIIADFYIDQIRMARAGDPKFQDTPEELDRLPNRNRDELKAHWWEIQMYCFKLIILEYTKPLRYCSAITDILRADSLLYEKGNSMKDEERIRRELKAAALKEDAKKAKVILEEDLDRIGSPDKRRKAIFLLHAGVRVASVLGKRANKANEKARGWTKSRMSHLTIVRVNSVPKKATWTGIQTGWEVKIYETKNVCRSGGSIMITCGCFPADQRKREKNRTERKPHPDRDDTYCMICNPTISFEEIDWPITPTNVREICEEANCTKHSFRRYLAMFVRIGEMCGTIMVQSKKLFAGFRGWSINAAKDGFKDTEMDNYSVDKNEYLWLHAHMPVCVGCLSIKQVISREEAQRKTDYQASKLSVNAIMSGALRRARNTGAHALSDMKITTMESAREQLDVEMGDGMETEGEKKAREEANRKIQEDLDEQELEDWTRQPDERPKKKRRVSFG